MIQEHPHPATVFDLKWAQTMDGQLCDDSGKSQWISSTEERILTHQMRAQYDVVLVGAGTYLVDLCQLTVRLGVDLATVLQPIRVILDPKGKIQEHLLSCDPQRRASVVEDLNQTLRKTYIVGRCQGLVDLGLSNAFLIQTELAFGSDFRTQIEVAMDFIRRLEGKNQLRVLVEGGARILAQMLQASMFRKVYVSVSPQMTGGVQNRIPLMRNLVDSIKLETKFVNQVGRDMFMEMEELR
ncbi:MAG: RibD family protein [Bdellovibrionales bacterium]|nr:RibD family protein [Bdellovibrionales bacterium]